MKTFIKHNAKQIKPNIWLKKLYDGSTIIIKQVKITTGGNNGK